MPYQSQSRNSRQNFSGRPRPGGIRGRNRRPVAQNQKRGGRGKAYIATEKFINTASTYELVEYVPTHRFADFPFSATLQENIAKKGYETPSAIQDQSIPHVCEGRDVIGLANTGTGKTAAFLLPLIDKMIGERNTSRVLIVAPTRELAQQINEEFKTFVKNLGLYSTTLVGGMNMNSQIRDLRRRPQFIIGTPGRIEDLIKQGELRLDTIKYLVLDEADRMLDMGFLPSIRRIISLITPDRQTLFFSATITPEIETLTRTFLHNPVTVQVRTGETSDHVEQDVVEFTDKDHKIELLANMLSKDEYEKVLVFGETKFGVQRLSEKLTNIGIPAAAIHGNKSQSQRQRALDAFKQKKVKVLVATDVAARGLDIPNVSHVINFDTPQTYDDYVHRIGRTGRAGARGQAHTFVPKG